MTHRPRSVFVRLLSWLLVLAVPAAAAVAVVSTAGDRGPLVFTLTLLLAIGSFPVWASAVHQMGLWVMSHRKPLAEPHDQADGRRIAVVMCTADDFVPERARECMTQDVAVELILLDDSHTPAHRDAIDAFAQVHGVRVVRRPDRTGFKGGSISNALAVLPDAPELWLIVDSDQRLPTDAARRLRARMRPGVAVVQGLPVPAPARTRFAALLGELPATHLAVSQAGRASPWFAGRAALIDTAAVRSVGGVPGRIAEDVALTIELRAAGFEIVNAPDVVAGEDAPCDVMAFRVQQLKFLEAATEILRGCGRRVMRSRIPLIEKGELIGGHLLVVAGVAGGAVALGAGIALAAIGAFPITAGAASGIAAVLPFAPHIVHLLSRGRIASAGAAVVVLPLLYGSLVVAAVGTLVRLALGTRPHFRVTPKQVARVGMRRWIRGHLPELALAGGGAALCAVAPMVTLPLVMPAAAALLFGALSGQSAVAVSSPDATRMRRLSPGATSAASRTTASPVRTTA